MNKDEANRRKRGGQTGKGHAFRDDFPPHFVEFGHTSEDKGHHAEHRKGRKEKLNIFGYRQVFVFTSPQREKSQRIACKTENQLQEVFRLFFHLDWKVSFPVEMSSKLSIRELIEDHFGQ